MERLYDKEVYPRGKQGYNPQSNAPCNNCVRVFFPSAVRAIIKFRMLRAPSIAKYTVIILCRAVPLSLGLIMLSFTARYAARKNAV